jgi:ligand-binding sensor domain-containing protein
VNHWGVFIAFFFGCALHAQTLELRYELPRQVKANQVSSLYKDPAGSVFLGTDRGLFSFDGRDWKGFSLPDSLKNKRISAITSFHRNLIIGLDNGRLLLFDGFSFDLYSPKNLSLSHSVRKLLLSKNQDLLIATYGDGLHILHADSSVTHYSRKQGLPSEDIYDVSISSEDHICLATDQGLVRIRPSSPPQVTLPSHLILHLSHPQPRDASILALDYDGDLFSIDATSVDTLFSTSASARGLAVNTSGDVFVVNSDTIWKASGPDYASATPIMLNAKDVWEKVWMDEQNQLWLINSNDQLVVVPTHLQKFQPLTSPIQCISAVDSILFLGTESGLYAYHPDSDTILYHLLSEYNLLDLEWIPERQELWCASFGQGIVILDRNQLRVERLTEAEGLINDNLLSLHVQDSIVLAATLGGLSLLDVSTHRPLYHLYDSIPQSQYIYDAAIDEQGILWLAKDRRGLLRLDQEGKITSFFGKSTIYHLMLDSIGLYAATSGSGVRYIERNTLDSFHFLGDRSCLAVAMDTFGHRYFFSEDGIHIHQPNNQHSVPFYPQYTSEEAYLFSHAYDLDAKGNLWWAQGQTLFKYVPQESVPIQVSLRILNFSLGEDSYSTVSNKVVVPHTQNTFRIHFQGHWINDPTAISYRYRIKNYDIDWQYSQDHSAVYPNLPPGEYTFIVEADLHSSFSQPAKKEIQFIIEPALWQRLWFQLLMGFIVLIVIISITRYIIRRNKRMEELKAARIRSELETIKSQINPHFMFNNFNTLLNIVEEDPEEAVVYIEQLSDFYRDMLQFRKETVISIREELDIVQRYFFLLKHRFGEALEYRIHGDISDHSYVIPFSIQLLVENAVKHNVVSRQTPLEIDIYLKSEYITVRNKLQIKPNREESTGFGLESLEMQYRNITGKSVEILSAEDMFEVRLPIIKEQKI